MHSFLFLLCLLAAEACTVSIGRLGTPARITYQTCCNFTIPFIQITVDTTPTLPPMMNTLNIPLFTNKCPVYHESVPFI